MKLTNIFSFLRGIFVFIAMAVCSVFWVSLLVAIFLLHFIVPVKSWRMKLLSVINQLPYYWTGSLACVSNWALPTIWDVTPCDNLDIEQSYLMFSNHSSWIDILVLYRIFAFKIPSPRFFMKRELKWQLPFLAQACQILGFPFVRRYSREFLKKNPQYAGKDIQITREALQKFKGIPITIINFVEGHRFTRLRHKKQNSPYQHLLKPKAGGLAFTISAMGDKLTNILDVTIIYPKQNLTLWDFMCGRVKKITVKFEIIPVTTELRGNYETDRQFRAFFQSWVNQLWVKKDKFLDRYYGQKS